MSLQLQRNRACKGFGDLKGLPSAQIVTDIGHVSLLPHIFEAKASKHFKGIRPLRRQNRHPVLLRRKLSPELHEAHPEAAWIMPQSLGCKTLCLCPGNFTSSHPHRRQCCERHFTQYTGNSLRSRPMSSQKRTQCCLLTELLARLQSSVALVALDASLVHILVDEPRLLTSLPLPCGLLLRPPDERTGRECPHMM